MKKIGLNINQLKLIAAVSMLIDHVGCILFPFFDIFRIVGRLAFPIFAFCLAEGVRYTKNRLRYLLTIGGCAVVFQMVFIFATGGNVVNIFGTLALSICLCYLFDILKTRKIGGFIIFLLAVFAVYVITRFIPFDYGFVGVLLPLSSYVFDSKPTDVRSDTAIVTDEEQTDKGVTLSLDEAPVNNVGKWAKFLCFSLTLATLATVSGWNTQYYALLAVPILSLYNGQYGSKKFKYWFYVFYPVHLVVIYFISTLM